MWQINGAYHQQADFFSSVKVFSDLSSIAAGEKVFQMGKNTASATITRSAEHREHDHEVAAKTISSSGMTKSGVSRLN